MTVERISLANLAKACRIQVSTQQSWYCAPVAYSIAESSFFPNTSCWVFKVKDIPIGFMELRDHFPTEADLYLWRLAIGSEHQKHGYGTTAFKILRENLRMFSTHEPKRIVSPVRQGEGSAVPFLERMGMRLTGKMMDETHAEMELVLG
jgi:diamine N-acetyltransferase